MAALTSAHEQLEAPCGYACGLRNRCCHSATFALLPSCASAGSPGPTADLTALIAEAAKNLADNQRLTAEGKLGEAGQKLEELKRALEKLNTRQR
jgi:hypothetical protein